jgi:hypothetical protein
MDFTPPVQSTGAKRKVSQGGSSANDGETQVKRSRLSTRDLQLSKAVASDRLEVALKKAKLQEDAMIKVCKMSASAKSDVTTKQLAAQKELMDQQLSSQKAMNNKRLDAEKAMHTEALQVQRDADKAATGVARETFQAQQVIEFTKIFRESGELPMEAIRLAKLAVYGPVQGEDMSGHGK